MFFFKRAYILLLFVVSMLLYSCGGNDEVHKADNGIEIIRYDKLVFGLDTNNIKREFDSIKSVYPKMTHIFFKNVLDMPGYNSDDSTFFSELKIFVSDTSMVDLYKLCIKEFGDMRDIRQEFKEVFDRAKKIDKSNEIPKVYSFVSGFAMQRFIFDDEEGRPALAFGEDMFLGKAFDYGILERGQGTFSDYFIRTYNKEHLVKKVLELWLDDVLGEPKASRAIDYIIKNGKKLYIIKQLMPDIQDSLLLDYSQEQMDWLRNNEQELWSFFIKKNLFFTTEDYEIKRLTSPAPNSQALGMPRKSPGYTGNYLGYRIVDTYMRRNKEKTTEALIKDKNAEKILSKSKFKPLKRK